jgi:hypothetical protein
MIDVSKYTAHKHPGKFEGESPETEYFYEQMLDSSGGETMYAPQTDDEMEGDYDDQTPCAEVFQIDADESDAFDLPIGHWFLLCTDSQGFVYGSVHPTREAAERAFNEWAGY